MSDFSPNLSSFKNLKKPKAIIWDWDNTLVDTWPLIHSAINATMTHMGKEQWSFKKVRDSVHKSMRESFPAIFGDEWQRAGEVYKNSYRSNNLSNLKLLPDVLEALELIGKKGILQMIVSNKIGATLRKEAEALDIHKLFFSLIGSGDADYDKPDSSPVWLALLGSDLDPKNDLIWFVGDTIADFDCAYNSHCQPIIFDIPNTISHDLLANGKNNEGAVPMFFTYRELIEKLKTMD